MTDRSFSLRFALYALLALALAAAVALPLARSNAKTRSTLELEGQGQTVAAILGANIAPGQLDGPVHAAGRQKLQLTLSGANRVRVRIVRRNGTVAFSNTAAFRSPPGMSDQVAQALAGKTRSATTDLVRPDGSKVAVLEVATPIVIGGRVAAVLVLDNAWKPFAAQIRQATLVPAASVGVALLLVYLALIPIMRRLLRERRSAERLVAARERLAQTIVERAPQGIWVLDDHGLIEFVNPRLEALLGYDTAEMIGRPISDFALVAPAERGREEVLLRRRDGVSVRALVETDALDDRGAAVATVIDIEEMKVKEESLADARQRLAAIVEAQRAIAELGANVGDAMAEIVARTHVLTESDLAFISFQEGDELVVRAVSNGDSFPVGDRCAVDKSLAGLALRTGLVQRTENTELDERVAPRWRRVGEPARSIVVVPLVGPDGSAPAVLGIVRARPYAFDDEAIETARLMAEFAAVALRNAADADERKQLLNAVAEGEERFRNAIESAPIGFALSTPDDRYVTVNEAYCRIVGRTREELQEMTWRDLTHPDDLDVETEPTARLIDGTVPYLDVEKRIVRGDGETVWVRIHISMARDVDGRVLYGVSQAQDITTERALERRVREREQLFRNVFEQSPLAKGLYGDDGRLIEANAAAAKLTGAAPDDLVGRHYSEFDPGDGTVEDFWDRLLATPGGLAGEELEIRTAGPRRHVIISGRANIRPGQHLVTVQDITEQRLLEERLRQGQKLESVGRLAGGVAHDFNNMLTAISGNAQLLLAGGDLDVLGRGRVAEIELAATRAAGLTRQLLAFGRQQVLRPSVVDLNVVVDGIADVLTRLIGPEIRFELDLFECATPVLADEQQLHDVVISLTANAREAMPNGGVLRLETAVAAIAENARTDVPPGAYATLTVSDTGVGMTQSEVERMFEPFYTTKGDANTGLGLASAHGIVHQSGGYITVSSEEDHGTRFRIWLPLADPDELVSIGAELPELAEVVADALTVLLVEDEPAVRDVVAEMLTRAGYTVLTAESGTAALALSADHDGPIDLLVTDVVMPGMSGTEVARLISEQRPGTRTLFVSGYNEEAIRHQGVLAPGTGFLEKPFSGSDLTGKARELLEAAPVC
jgi:PAS domain S-box-containing protein